MIDDRLGVAIPGGTLHHFGLATNDLDGAVRLMQMLGFEPEGEVFEDPIQGVRGWFWCHDGSRVEILAPLPGSNTLQPWLTVNGPVLYHMAYEVPDMRAAQDWLRARRLRFLAPPRPAVAFSGRHIAFAALGSRLLLELVERESTLDGSASRSISDPA